MSKNRNSMPIGLGIPTILVIFVVLGMTILSVLTYLKASQNDVATKKEIAKVTQYYEADSYAKYLCDEIRLQNFDEATLQTHNVTKTKNGYNFYVTMEEGRKLKVEMDTQGNILVWKMIKEGA